MVNDPVADDADVRPWSLPDMGSAQIKQLRDERLRKRTPQIKPPSAEELQAIRDGAHEDGLRDGYAQGLVNAETEARAQLKKKLGQFDALAAALARPLQQMDDAAENTLVDMVIALSSHILRRELSLQPEQVLQVVREAIKLLPVSAQTIRIYLQPDDAQLLREAMALDNSRERPWQVFDEASLSRGGCRVQTDDTLVDYSLEQRMALAFAPLLHEREVDDDQVGTNAGISADSRHVTDVDGAPL